MQVNNEQVPVSNYGSILSFLLYLYYLYIHLNEKKIIQGDPTGQIILRRLCLDSPYLTPKIIRISALPGDTRSFVGYLY